VIRPDPEVVDEVVGMIAEAERPIVIGGRGATWSGAKTALEALAEESGALLATTLLGKGLFDGNPFALDIAGTFATDLGREYFAESDLVISAGAGLGHYTTEGGYLFPSAKVVRIDTQPRGLWQGLRTADLHVQADARAAAEAVVARLKEKGIRRRGWRGNEVASKIAATAENPDPKPYTPTPGTLDPRPVIKELDATIPKDWDIIVAGGHCFSFAMTHLRGRPAGKYHIPIDFGAIGSGLSAAIGVAAARNNGKVMLIDGDGSLLSAHPGARNDPATRHQAPDLHHQRWGLRCRDAQIPRLWGGPDARDPRPRRPRSGGMRLRAERRQGDHPRSVRGIVPRTPSARRLDPMGRPRRRPDPLAQLPPCALRRSVTNGRAKGSSHAARTLRCRRSSVSSTGPITGSCSGSSD
jgi:thiamine pyrophosphate-dependent enzyme